MVLKREEIMKQVKGLIGEKTDDASLKFLEDLSDTFNDYDERVKGDEEDWKTKFEENDKQWRQRYQERFFSGSTADEGNSGKKDDPLEPSKLPEEEINENEPVHFEDLFTTES